MGEKVSTQRSVAHQLLSPYLGTRPAWRVCVICFWLAMKVKKKALSTRSSQASQGRKFPKMNLLKSHGWRQAGHLRKQICNFDCDAETANLQCLKVSCEVTLLHYLTTFTWLDHNSSPQYLTWLHYSTAVLKEASLLHFITWLLCLTNYFTSLLGYIMSLHALRALRTLLDLTTVLHYSTIRPWSESVVPQTSSAQPRWHISVKKTPGFRVFAIYFV